MARGATRRPSIGRRIKDIKNKESQLFSLFRRSNTPSGIQPAFVAGGSSTSEQGGSESSFLPTAGGTMIGPIAFFPKLITIVSGAIDISKNTDNFTSRVILTPESGSTDDLVTITGAEHNGQLLFIQGVQTDTITLKTTGNIETIDGTDFNIVDDDIIIFQFDVTDNKWQQITIGKQSVAGITFPIIPTVDVRGSVSTNQAVDISQTDGHVTTMTLGANITVTFSGFPATGTQQTWELHVLQDATGGRTLTVSPTPVETFSIATGANTLTILTFLTNDGGTDIHVVPTLRGSISLAGNFLPLAGGTLTGNLVMSGANIDLNNNNIIDINDLLFNEAGQTIISDTGGLNFNVPAADTFEWFIAGVPELTLSAGNLDFQGNSINDLNDILFTESGQTIISDATGLSFNVPTADQFNFLINGVSAVLINSSLNLDLQNHNIIDVNTLTVAGLAAFNGAVSLGNAIGDLITVSGEIASDINMGGFDFKDLSNIEFRNTTGIPGPTVASMWADGGGITFNVPTDDSFDFQINQVSNILINSSGNIDMQNNSIIDLNDILFTIPGQTIITDTNGITFTATGGDFLRFIPGTTLTVDMDDFFLRVLNVSGAQDPQLILDMTDTGIINDQLIGRIFFQSNDSANNRQQYASIEAEAELITSASEEGRLILRVATGSTGALKDGIVVQGGTGTNIQLAFYGGATPIDQPSHIADPTGGSTIDTEARTAINSILADLAALGLQASS